MKQSRLLLVLLQPSILSFVCASLFAAVVLLASSWTFIKTQPFLAPYFSEHYGFHTLTADMSAAIGRALDNLLPYNVIVVGFALFVGLIVFVTLEGVRHMHQEMDDTFDQVKFANAQSKQAMEKSIETRIGLKAVVGIAWLGYSLFYFNTLIPLCATIVAKSTTHAPLAGPASNLLAFMLLLAATHLHVIFARLLVLRPRLFGATYGA